MQIHPTKVEMAKEENKEQEEQLESKTQCDVEETNVEGSKLEAFIKFPLAMVEDRARGNVSWGTNNIKLWKYVRTLRNRIDLWDEDEELMDQWVKNKVVISFLTYNKDRTSSL